ncbi:MAG: PQQ-dependent sugar dehydrogenase [Candidatus Heimdallarchaeota archaeon]|nr:PQQ-dependent sugar dehydrogenase [Candidatus Heimdallarchaeota archaeon]
MRKKKVLVIILIIITLGAIILIPYFPLYFGDLGTIIEDYDLEPSFGDLIFSEPVDIQFTSINDSGNIIYRLFVVEQRGIIHEVVSHNSSDPLKSTFLDIQNIVTSGGEKGLLGLAFDPNFETNGYFYVDYTASSPLRTVISRFTVDKPLNGLPLLSSEKLILEVNQPYENHNAGQIMFGLDGFLYVTLGDGGLANDPDENGQNRKTLLGSILRLDVNVTDSISYTIPEDNPYYNNTNGYREEIYAYGFRNPWRISQDPATAYIYVGDVGQNRIEEIDVITPNDKGKNYGWDKKEGNDCFLSISCSGDYVDPIAQYSHSEGISVTGGYVYHGDELINLDGYYIYGDYISGKIWGVKYNDSEVVDNKFVLQYEIRISTFGLNWNGDLLVADYSGGVIYTIINV